MVSTPWSNGDGWSGSSVNSMTFGLVEQRVAGAHCAAHTGNGGRQMIVSYELGAAFIKTRKTAGTSVEIALSPHCGPRDIITPIIPRDEMLRAAITDVGPQNWRIPPWQWRSRDLPGLVRKRRPKFYHHCPAAEVRDRVGGRVWDNLFTFTIERNPWDRLVSLYFYMHPEGTDEGFSAWLRALPPEMMSNWPLYADGDRLLVDHIVVFEEGLDGRVGDVFAKLGLPQPRLPHAKAGLRPRSSVDYRRFFSDDDEALVGVACRREIAMFGYTFERKSPITTR